MGRLAACHFSLAFCIFLSLLACRAAPDVSPPPAHCHLTFSSWLGSSKNKGGHHDANRIVLRGRVLVLRGGGDQESEDSGSFFPESDANAKEASLNDQNVVLDNAFGLDEDSNEKEDSWEKLVHEEKAEMLDPPVDPNREVEEVPMLQLEFMEAARTGNETALAALIAAGADVNFRDRRDHGRTALHIAAGRGQSAACCRLLLAAGAAVDAKDDGHCRPLHFAAETVDPDVIEALVEGGADRNVLNLFGHTPKFVAQSVYDFCADNPELEDNSEYDPAWEEQVRSLLHFPGAEGACRPAWPTAEQRAAKPRDHLDLDFLDLKP